MNDRAEIEKRVRAALERDEGVDVHDSAIAVSFRDGRLTLEGEVESVLAKKRAAYIARRAGGMDCVDRLRVRPTEERGDGAIRDALCEALMQDSTFHDCAIRARAEEGGLEGWQQAFHEPSGRIDISVRDGVVTLDGHVPSPSHKCLVIAMAWWIRGCRDVVNHLEVRPPREETDDEITEAVWLVLEKDPSFDVEQISISTRNRVVTLEGLLHTAEGREEVESDVWCLPCVEAVVNNIEVEKLAT